MRPIIVAPVMIMGTPFSGTSPLASCKGVPPPPDSHAEQETLQTRLPFPQPSGRPFRLGDLT